jgi:hypothetical protein
MTKLGRSSIPDLGALTADIQPGLELDMPLFRYENTRGRETKTTELRKSNPQGWLPDAVRATFPDVASRRSGDLWDIRLTSIAGENESWRATLRDEPDDLVIRVTKMRR